MNHKQRAIKQILSTVGIVLGVSLFIILFFWAFAVFGGRVAAIVLYIIMIVAFTSWVVEAIIEGVYGTLLDELRKDISKGSLEVEFLSQLQFEYNDLLTDSHTFWETKRVVYKRCLAKYNELTDRRKEVSK